MEKKKKTEENSPAYNNKSLQTKRQLFSIISFSYYYFDHAFAVVVQTKLRRRISFQGSEIPTTLRFNFQGKN